MSEQEQKRIFTNNLNRLLSERQKTQKEVADAIGVLPTTFNTWCKGVALPRMGKVQLLADYFRISKSELIEECVADSSASSLPLRPDESTLLQNYNVLNHIGKEKAQSDIEDLTQIEKYTEDDREAKKESSAS